MLYYIVYSNLTNKKNTIKTNYPDTYDFLKSLQNRLPYIANY